MDTEKSPSMAHHPAALIRIRLDSKGQGITYLKDFIYGSIDGTVTTFAIVTGVVGAGLPASVILTLGLANLLADGFSMAASNFLGSRADLQARDQKRGTKPNRLQRPQQGECEYIRQIFADNGFSHRELDRIMATINENEGRWNEAMLSEDHRQASNNPVPWCSAMITFVAFIAVGAVPLLSFFTNFLFPGALENPFPYSVILTGFAFLAVGAIKGTFASRHWIFSSLETLLVGGTAASIAYFVGHFLRNAPALG
ncbi:MAG: VIT1/CCC1 transporter family protein [Verrucomicrobiota bacterium]